MNLNELRQDIIDIKDNFYANSSKEVAAFAEAAYYTGTMLSLTNPKNDEEHLVFVQVVATGLATISNALGLEETEIKQALNHASLIQQRCKNLEKFMQ